MRTTLTLDDDVATELERIRRDRDLSLKEVVNETLRKGLERARERPRKREPFRTAVVDLGRCVVGNLDNVAELLAVAEGESYE
jgi:hypothetical protein